MATDSGESLLGWSYIHSNSSSAVDQADRALNAAAQALQSTRSKSSKGEQSDTAGQILAAANVVVNILGGLASLHPATDVSYTS